MAKPWFVGLDVGGTAMKSGVVDDAGRPSGSVSLPTEAHRGQEFGLERMCETIRQAVAAAQLQPLPARPGRLGESIGDRGSPET